MNERIRKLAGAALDKAVPYTWTTLDYNQILELLECHSQLVIKECVGVIKSGSFLHDEAPTAVFARECSSAVNRHFGVEE